MCFRLRWIGHTGYAMTGESNIVVLTMLIGIIKVKI